ncbi:G-protein coupled receptor GRL101-like 2, partial [Homarus americanus]
IVCLIIVAPSITHSTHSTHSSHSSHSTHSTHSSSMDTGNTHQSSDHHHCHTRTRRLVEMEGMEEGTVGEVEEDEGTVGEVEEDEGTVGEVEEEEGTIGEVEEEEGTVGEVEEVCEPGWWQCWGGSQCVPLNATCSGVPQCADGSDELQEMCESYTCADTHYKCDNGFCVPRDVLCDFDDDCGDSSDEHYCLYRKCYEEEFTCGNGECVFPGFVCDGEPKCSDGSDETHCQPEDFAVCKSGRLVHRHFWCDGSADCADNHADELHCVAVCQLGQSIRCGILTGDRQEERCVAAEYVCDGIDHCHIGKKRLSDELECWHMSKPCLPPEGEVEPWVQCSDGRCVPKSLLCNREGACPNGQDANGCPVMTCKEGEWQCFSGQCIPLQHHCDGKFYHCNDSSDERNCRKVNEKCTSDWRPCSDGRCIPGAFFCDEKVDCLNGEDEDNCIFSCSKNAAKCRCFNVEANCSSLDLQEFPDTEEQINIFDLSRNHIAHLRNDVFAHLWRLKILDLRDNHLTNLTANAFNGLLNLRHLSGNSITSLASHAFYGLTSLATLDVSHNSIVTVNYNTFQHIPKLKFLCVPEADEFSTCEDLMSNLVLRVSIWVLGLVALFGNTFVIIWRSAFSSFNKLNSFLIVNLALGDLLMGFYLIVVGGVDLHYRGVYAEHQLFWRTSWLCQMAGFLIITVERLRIIMHPSHNKSTKPTKLVMAGVWIVVGVLATLPLVNREYFNNFYGRSGVCLALHITQEKPSGWEYSVFIFLGLNFVSFGVIAVSYVLMYFAVRKTRMEAARISRREDENLAKRMTLIVFSWVAVFILPLNAAVNPVLYTLSTSPVRKKLGTIRQSLSSRNSGSATGIPLPPIKRPRESTLSSDVVKTSDKGTAVNTKDTVCVYKPGTAHTQDVLTCLHKSPEAV